LLELGLLGFVVTVLLPILLTNQQKWLSHVDVLVDADSLSGIFISSFSIYAGHYLLLEIFLVWCLIGSQKTSLLLIVLLSKRLVLILVGWW